MDFKYRCFHNVYISEGNMSSLHFKDLGKKLKFPEKPFVPVWHLVLTRNNRLFSLNTSWNIVFFVEGYTTYDCNCNDNNFPLDFYRLNSIVNIFFSNISKMDNLWDIQLVVVLSFNILNVKFFTCLSYSTANLLYAINIKSVLLF